MKYQVITWPLYVARTKNTPAAKSYLECHVVVVLERLPYTPHSDLNSDSRCFFVHQSRQKSRNVCQDILSVNPVSLSQSILQSFILPCLGGSRALSPSQFFVPYSLKVPPARATLLRPWKSSCGISCALFEEFAPRKLLNW